MVRTGQSKRTSGNPAFWDPFLERFLFVGLCFHGCLSATAGICAEIVATTNPAFQEGFSRVGPPLGATGAGLQHDA
jgi:hypothetical protein